MMPTAYTPQGKLVTLLAHTRFHRVRHQQVKGTNSPLDPRLADYWEERRERSLLRRLVADGSRRRRYLLRRQQNRCAITGHKPPGLVFSRLLDAHPSRFVVMTGGGDHPIFFADRSRRLRGTAEPADLGRIERPDGMPLIGSGAGDVFACVLARCLAVGQAVEVAVGWARLYATAHVCGQRFNSRRRAEEWQTTNNGVFPPVAVASVPRLAA